MNSSLASSSSVCIGSSVDHSQPCHGIALLAVPSLGSAEVSVLAMLNCWMLGATCAEEGSHNVLLLEETCACEIWSNTIHTHRERERGTKSYILINQRGNSYKWTTTLEKGYRVTLYSDSLRATTLYPIYINGPNLGTQRGWCEYDHYTLVFDTPP